VYAFDLAFTMRTCTRRSSSAVCARRSARSAAGASREVYVASTCSALAIV
jgi:hypothetical protein